MAIYPSLGFFIDLITLSYYKYFAFFAPEPETSEDFKTEAEIQITEENLQSELEKLEKEIAEDEESEL